MTGRTYAIGYEPDLEETLFIRPLSRILNPELAWAIWYPLRRRGAFEQLSSEAQRDILKEHGTIGHQFGTAQLAYDVRLDCHGLDAADNDFVIGILGRELTPLSKVVEHMRATTQTAQYLEKLGPFFVGKVYAQHG
jgi:chlorite dismutase